jgi:hypothetical protein
MEDNLIWLAKWFASLCNGDWEHGNTIHIEALDNPGWHLTVDLNDTGYENKEFSGVIIERTENDWVHCFVRNRKFEGAGGVLNLSEIIEKFRAWIES